MVLSAGPVRQTVRGSLGGVPQGSIIGLLEKPPLDWTPTDIWVGVRGQGLGEEVVMKDTSVCFDIRDYCKSS